jgi:hypothetical protein
MTIEKQWQQYASLEIDHYQRTQFGAYIRRFIGRSKTWDRSFLWGVTSSQKIALI